MKYLATFYTHYGALCFHKYCDKNGIRSKMEPVPRVLSSSCGVCTRFETDSAPDPLEHEDMEGCYMVTDKGYNLISEGQK